MRTIFFYIILLVLGLAFLGYRFFSLNSNQATEPTQNTSSQTSSNQNTEQATNTPIQEVNGIAIIAGNLDIPWDIAFLPNEDFLITERKGTLVRINKDGSKISIPVPGIKATGESGLLGIALSPDFSDSNLLYLYLTGESEDSKTENRVERYRLINNTLLERQIIISSIPASAYHDGGRIAFSKDNYLYITTGDAGTEDLAQNTKSLAGKILRIYDNGDFPEDNPFPNSAIYSYGHRNPQGLTWDSNGNLWSTEHGRSGLLSGFDELNLIEPGKNYGWPMVQGDQTQPNLTPPKVHSGPSITWAPASAAYFNGSIFFGGLKGETLYEAVIGANNEILRVKEHFKNEFGRIRTVRVGPDKYLYLTTSNRDGRGQPSQSDDKLIRINPSALK